MDNSKKSLPSLIDLRNSIPDEYFRPNVIKSLYFFGFDIFIISLLYISVYLFDSVYYLPIFWFATGTMFWSLFVVGHDCGHGSFSKSKFLNSLIGHLCHTPLLVPYHGWRISHQMHHRNTGNIDKDETWYPLTENQFNNLTSLQKIARYKLFLIVFPLYLFVRSPGKDGSHFLPSSPLFNNSERNRVLVSTSMWALMVLFLLTLIYMFGLYFIFIYYFIPFTIFVIWLSLVTYLHHTDVSIPWYRGEDWSFTKGALSTIDRSYGIFDPIHHNIGTHVIHHVFAGIPHYNLIGAKNYIKKILGDSYREDYSPILSKFLESSSNCDVVNDIGSPVYYKKANK